MSDLEFVKEFGKIQIKEICKKVKVDCSNFYSGRTSAEKSAKVKSALIEELEELLANG